MNIQRSDYDAYLFPNYAPAPFIPVRGEGVWVWDQSGRALLDLGGGIAVLGLGHCHPKVVDALTTQAKTLWHVSNLFCNEPALNLAKHLISKSFAERVFFCNSGAEANEGALKLARRVAFDRFGAQKFKIISTVNAFHGRTLFTVTAGGQPKYSDGFGPLPAGIEHIPFNDIAALEAAMSDEVCAIIVEPIQGESGVLPATKAFLEAARTLADKHHACLIFDEVQTGCGRTGKLFAHEQFEVVPDILTAAKSLGNGFPIGAVLTREALAKHFTVGTHGTTYGGNPLACAVAYAVISEIDQSQTYENIAARSQQLREGLMNIAANYCLFDEVRGMGLLLGAVLSERYRDRAGELLGIVNQEGVLAMTAGTNVLRFAPSLLISEAEISEALTRLARAFSTFATQK